jgi:hypothetical protein
MVSETVPSSDNEQPADADNAAEDRIVSDTRTAELDKGDAEITPEIAIEFVTVLVSDPVK